MMDKQENPPEITNSILIKVLLAIVSSLLYSKVPPTGLSAAVYLQSQRDKKEIQSWEYNWSVMSIILSCMTIITQISIDLTSFRVQIRSHKR